MNCTHPLIGAEERVGTLDELTLVYWTFSCLSCDASTQAFDKEDAREEFARTYLQDYVPPGDGR